MSFNRIFVIAFSCFFFMHSVVMYGQSRKEKRIDEEFPTPVAFPYEFVGKYTGNLNVSDNTGTIANIPTEFVINGKKGDKYFEYEFSYLQNNKKIKEKFQLHIIDEDKGFYVITNNKDLEFMATLIRDTLYGTYENDNKLTLTSFQFTNTGQLRFSIILSQKNTSKKSKRIFV